MTFLLIFCSSLAIYNLISGETYNINKETVNIRMSPATNSQSVDQVQSGDNVVILKEQNGWYRVRFQNTSQGWIPKWLLENDEIVSDQELAAEIILSTPVYAEQSADSLELARINAGEFLFVNFESNGWTQVIYDNQIGYIPTENTKFLARDNIPSVEEDLTEDEEDALAEEVEAASRVIIVRQSNQAFLTQADVYSDIIYTPSYNQRFELIDTFEDEMGEEIYFVEDEDGIRGYLESRVTAKASDYYGHIGLSDANSIAEATVVIDAGHGGEDAGAISSDELTYEKNATLLTAELLQEKLEALGATVIMTRNNDDFVDLEERAEISNQAEADAFISIHYDASIDPNWHGTTTYYFNENDFNLANAVNESISQDSSLPNNGVVFGNYFVLRENNRPNLLIELGHMSNEFDLGYIRSEDYHNQMAQAIADALATYFGGN